MLVLWVVGALMLGVTLVLSTTYYLVRVQVGPYTNQEEARAVADQVQSRLGFKPFVSVH